MSCSTWSRGRKKKRRVVYRVSSEESSDLAEGTHDAVADTIAGHIADPDADTIAGHIADLPALQAMFASKCLS